MTNFSRMTALGSALAALTLAATPAAAAPVGPTNGNPKARAQVVKPLTLTSLADLHFGTIVMGDLSGGAETVSISAATGAVTCGGAVNLTCSGTPARAQFQVTGSNNQTVYIRSTATTLTNTNQAGTLSFTPAHQATLALGNSGATGANFYVGGSISISSTTTDGLYEGDVQVTVDYN